MVELMFAAFIFVMRALVLCAGCVALAAVLMLALVVRSHLAFLFRS